MEEFNFLQETIKKEPVRKWLIKRSIQFLGIGLLLGVLATVASYTLAPWFAERFQERPKKVTIVEDEEELLEEQEEVTVNGPEIVEETHEERMKAILATVEQAQKCMVTVNGDVKDVSGIIVADNGLQVLILTSNIVCDKGTSCEVLFGDEQVYPANLLKQDRNTGLAVLAIDRETMDKGTLEYLEYAELGNSSLMVEGKTAVAFGYIFNPENEIHDGRVRVTEDQMDLADGRYRMLGTDIEIMRDGTGILFNTEGQVTGLMLPGIREESDEFLANAYAISDLKPVIQKLSNGEAVPYIGIYGATVDEETSLQLELPIGVYVRQVNADSPAMIAGIQSGDVLTEIGGQKITNVDIYKRTLQNMNVGDIVILRGQRRGQEGYVDMEYHVTIGSWE